jgi:hypothetical protein
MNVRDIEQRINRPAFFDWLVFAISFSLGFIFPSLKEFVISPSFSYWMLAALLLYTAGAWLKHLPLSYRVTTTGESLREVPYMLFLMIGHWIILFTAIIFSGGAIRKIFNLPLPHGNDSSTPFLIVGNIILAGLITWLVFRTKRKKHFKKTYSPQYLFRRELIADIILVAGVSILSFIFWEKGIMTLLANARTNSIGDLWFLFIMLGICFMLFYLPLRYLFFIEDHSNSQTWKRLLLIFSLILLKSLFEMLRI